MGNFFSKSIAELKAWIKSKTIWFSVVGVPAIMSALAYAQDTLPLIKENLGASYAMTTFIITLSGILLRRMTSTALHDK